jgi:hypothetical protein
MEANNENKGKSFLLQPLPLAAGYISGAVDRSTISTAFWRLYAYCQGGRLIFNRVLCCCHRGAQTKTFVIWLQFCTYDLSTHGASAFCSRLCMRYCLFPRKYLHAACVWPMWRAGMSIWHDHVHANNSWLAGEKRPGNPRRPHISSLRER